MFCRRWSGLPSDPEFPANITELGYFINKDDEIRSIENEDYYFKYFLSKNERHNHRQRFSFNTACRSIFTSRLEDEGLQTLLLPLGTKTTDEPHVPIMHTADLGKKSRVVLVLGESCQELGAIAYRIINGRGGINKGSMVNLVQALKKQTSSATDSSPPGIILANTGELWWWPEGKRSLTPSGRHGIPLMSSASWGVYHDPQVNEIPQNRKPVQHMEYLLEHVVPSLIGSETKLDIIAVGDGAENAYRYFGDERNWARYKDILGCFAVMGGFLDASNVCEGFRHFLKDRGRAYALSSAPLGTPLCGPYGKLPADANFAATGCATFSAGEACHVAELILVEAQPSLLPWMQEVAIHGAGEFSYEVYVDEGLGGSAEEAVPEAKKDGCDEDGEDEENIRDGDAKRVPAVTPDVFRRLGEA